jgi:hypothetical protein
MGRQIRDSSKWASQVLHPEKRIIDKMCVAEKRTISNQGNGSAIMIVGNVSSVFNLSNEFSYTVGEITCYGAMAPAIGDSILVNGVVSRGATLNGCVFRTIDSYAANSVERLAASAILSGRAKSIAIKAN